MSLRQRLFEGPQPTLTTERLTLRPFTLEDVPHIREFNNHKEIAAVAISTGFPFEEDEAKDFILRVTDHWKQRSEVTFAIVPHDLGHPIGEVSLELKLDHDVAEIGYSLGVQYWGNGYATEAAKRVLQFGFYDLDLQCVYAVHWPSNEASGKVLRKLGMTLEGRLRSREKKWGKYYDLDSYSVNASEFHKQ